MERRKKMYEERYKYVLPANWSEKIQQFEAPQYYFVSGFQHPKLAIVKHDGIFLYEWGLIPHWIKDEKTAKEIQSKTLNAVGETLFEKPSFKSCVQSQRCLLGINGFFEWKEVNRAKQPYFIHATSQEIFSLGCIYDSWLDKNTGELRHTFSIITTPANALLEEIHNTKKRMPLIIAPEDETAWLNPNLPIPAVRNLIKTYTKEDLTAYPISKMANSPKNDKNVKEVLAKIENEVGDLFS